MRGQSASFSAASCESRSASARWSCSLYRGSGFDCRSFSTRARESSNTSLRRRVSNSAGVNCRFFPEVSLSSNSCTWPSTDLLSHPLAMRPFYVDDSLANRNFSRSVSFSNIECFPYKNSRISVRQLRVAMQTRIISEPRSLQLDAKNVCCNKIHVPFRCGRRPASGPPLNVRFTPLKTQSRRIHNGTRRFSTPCA